MFTTANNTQHAGSNMILSKNHGSSWSANKKIDFQLKTTKLDSIYSKIAYDILP